MNVPSTLIVAATCIAALMMNHYQWPGKNASAPKALESIEKLGKSPNPAALASIASDLRASLARDDKDAWALFGLAWALQLQGQPKLSEAEYEKANNEAKEICKFSHYNLSFIREQQNDLVGALEQVVESKTCAPDFIQAVEREKTLRELLEAPADDSSVPEPAQVR